MTHKYGHLPWYKRYWFINTFLGIYAVYVLFLLPPAGSLNWFATLELIVTSLLYITVLAVVQLDREKPDWLKNLLALGFMAVLAWFFYRYSGARWERFGRFFLNFEIMQRGNPLSASSTTSNWELMFQSLGIALQLFLYSTIFSTLLGLALAVVRTLVNDAILNRAIDAYVDVFRSVPPIAMLLVVYSSLPYSGIVLSPFLTGVLVLTIIESSYLCEVFRAGIGSIHSRQTESARALGLSASKTMRLVILPQAVRTVLPPYTNRMIGLMKRTAECSVIAIPEILQTARQIQSWYGNTTPLMVAALMYLLVLLPLTKAATILERSRRQA